MCVESTEYGIHTEILKALLFIFPKFHLSEPIVK